MPDSDTSSSETTAFGAEKKRKRLTRAFADGRLPSGADFEELITAMALDAEFKEFAEVLSPLAKKLSELEASEDLTDVSKSIVINTQKAIKHGFRFDFGMPVRFGTFEEASETRLGSECKEISAKEPINIYSKDKQDPFIFEVVAHLQDSAEGKSKPPILFHGIAMYDGESYSNQTHYLPRRVKLPFVGIPLPRGKQIALAGFFGSFFWLIYIFYSFFSPEIPGDPTRTQLVVLGAGLASSAIGLVLYFFEWIVALRQKAKLKLEWTRWNGLTLSVAPVRTSAPSKLKYHVTRLY